MKKHITALFIVFALTLSGCAFLETPKYHTSASTQPLAQETQEKPAAVSNKAPPERHRELARQLSLITLKAQGELEYGAGFNDSSEIIPYLKQKHPKSYNQFTDSILKFRIDSGHVLGLVCDKDRGYGIAEDSPCTEYIEVTYSEKNADCVFTVSNAQQCAAN